jgi:hypothetical protein
MSALSMVRTISHVGVRLAGRHGGEGQPTARWQDKMPNGYRTRRLSHDPGREGSWNEAQLDWGRVSASRFERPHN